MLGTSQSGDAGPSLWVTFRLFLHLPSTIGHLTLASKQILVLNLNGFITKSGIKKDRLDLRALTKVLKGHGLCFMCLGWVIRGEEGGSPKEATFHFPIAKTFFFNPEV